MVSQQERVMEETVIHIIKDDRKGEMAGLLLVNEPCRCVPLLESLVQGNIRRVGVGLEAHQQATDFGILASFMPKRPNFA